MEKRPNWNKNLCGIRVRVVIILMSISALLVPTSSALVATLLWLSPAVPVSKPQHIQVLSSLFGRYYIIYTLKTCYKLWFYESGELVEEIHQIYNSWVGQTIRIYKGQEHVELDWVVGPLPVEWVITTFLLLFLKDLKWNLNSLEMA